MDRRSQLLDHETDFVERCDGANFITKQDIRLIEGITMQHNILRVRSNRGNNVFGSKSDSMLWRKDDRKIELNELMKDSINLAISSDADKSVAIVPSAKLQTRQLSSNRSCLLYNDGSLRNSFSHQMSISLPAIPTSSLDTFLVKSKTNESENDVHTCGNIATICADKEETLFNRSNEIKNPLYDLQCSMNKNTFDICQNNPQEYEHDKSDFKEQIIANSISNIEQSCEKIIDSQLRINNSETLIKKNIDKKDLCEENKSKSALTVNVQARNNLMSRPTLADDSKLVKMSLLTNPMNIMQSNAQLLNKSRNFLNFITEKSTNIMEKALLPQHLAMRYNRVSKSVDTDIARVFYANNESSLKDVLRKSDTDLTTNSPNASYVTNDMANQNHDKNEDKLDSVTCSKNEANPSACVEENKMRDLESEAISSERKYFISRRNDVDELDFRLDVTDERIKSVLLLTEMDQNKNTFQREKLHDDTRKEVSPDIRTLADSYVSKYGSLAHPLYLMLMEDYTNLKLRNSKLLEEMEYLEKSKRSDESFKEIQVNMDACTLQVRNLEKAVNKLTSDLDASLITQETLRNECNVINKEKENMIMKYVISEKQLIDSQRARDTVERKVKELLKDQELLQNKLRQTQGERTRICNILDGKCHEIADLQKEIEKLKEDVKLKEIKLKWTQNKLKTEMDSQKDTQQKLDKALMKINYMKEECEQIRRETQESFRKFQQSEENKAITLDQQLKEHQARLILERHVTEDKETLRLRLQKELETLKSKQQDLIEENKRLSLKIQDSEKARLNYENNSSDLKMVANQRQEQITELLNRVSHLETLKFQLQHKEEYITSAEIQMQQLRSANEELQSDMQACRQKEADMLDFTQKLTDKNICLQSEFITLRTKANHLESEHAPLRECINELTNKVKVLEDDLMHERKKRREECEILAKHVAEQTQFAQNLAQKLEDSQGENAVLKRKHQISIKEMTRELQQCRRKLEMFEAASPSNSLDVTSRTGSNISLNTGDTLNGALSDNNVNGDHIHSTEPNRQVLMNRIIKLQKINVRRAEKIDFLEEHTQALVEELQKKTKIIQNYILHQNFGALGCNERDRHKAELARHGGIMASVYNHRVSDENMTLELSLEINQKLQAVLEDALLKNITLKDNIDTLGNEISRLTMQHQQRQIED